MNLRKLALFLIDSAFLVVSYIFTYLLSTLSEVNTMMELDVFLHNFVFYYVTVFGVRCAAKVYSNVWRYANNKAYLAVIGCDFLSYCFATMFTRLVLHNFWYVSVWFTVSNIVIFTLLTLLSRFVYQMHMNIKNSATGEAYQIPVAIVGAGQTGSLLVEELLHNSNSHYRPVCFIDKDKYKVGGYISGIKVIGEDDMVFKHLKDLSVKEIFIALPKLSSSEAHVLYDYYSNTGCKIKLYDFAINGNTGNVATRRSLRELKIEDLLFRDTLQINDNDTYNYYRDKVVLVTGGGGSIGSEICRQLVKAEPRQLIIFDIYENNAYDIQQELHQNYGSKLNLAVEIGSIRDYNRLDDVFNKYKPDIVFHAAAHKHVPLMENSCCEALKNNVFGTLNTVNVSEKHAVKKFIMISTDKAVNPTNVMGATKRMCEMIVQSRFDSATTEFAAVRFGNVLGSNGSVIPLFRRQIEAGGPVTITDRRIIRYFMTIPEASQLVMQAGSMAKNGELYVLDMGNPVKIIDLAINMIKLAGYVPYRDINIIETGLRPGEKLYEELLIQNDDNLERTKNNLIFVERDAPLSREEVDKKLAVLKEALSGDNDDIKSALMQVVPTFHSADVVNSKAAESKEMQMCK
ncbi:MAG: polysaccharide biosynthesis protein [Ruminococcaceae bacterium]|nr:polysaccharide biosynthesis protein [Oscillospiraceae bacterium]